MIHTNLAFIHQHRGLRPGTCSAQFAQTTPAIDAKNAHLDTSPALFMAIFEIGETKVPWWFSLAFNGITAPGSYDLGAGGSPLLVHFQEMGGEDDGHATQGQVIFHELTVENGTVKGNLRGEVNGLKINDGQQIHQIQFSSTGP